jgi:nuclear migration protein JNM1
VPSGDVDAGSSDKLESLSQVLNEISKPTGLEHARKPSKALLSDAKAGAEATMGHDATYSITYAPAYEQSHALAKAADFDRRLVMLEKDLGITSAAVADTDANGLPRAIIPTLDNLERQISTLAQASTANLDAISRRVRSLASEQEKLNDSREKAKALREELGKSGALSPTEDSEQDAKINALYAILPTIENLTPILPPLLDRLRSLRAIHAESATASETLSRIEREQSEMAAELKIWREGLEKLESSIAEGDAATKGNMKVMEGWVKDLEARMAKLS